MTGTGKVYGTTPTETLDRLDELWRQLRRARKLWRADRCYLRLHYALLPQAQMGFGYLSASVTPIYRLAYLAWLRVNPVTGEEEEVFG